MQKQERDKKYNDEFSDHRSETMSMSKEVPPSPSPFRVAASSQSFALSGALAGARSFASSSAAAFSALTAPSTYLAPRSTFAPLPPLPPPPKTDGAYRYNTHTAYRTKKEPLQNMKYDPYNLPSTQNTEPSIRHRQVLPEKASSPSSTASSRYDSFSAWREPARNSCMPATASSDGHLARARRRSDESHKENLDYSSPPIFTSTPSKMSGCGGGVHRSAAEVLPHKLTPFSNDLSSRLDELSLGRELSMRSCSDESKDDSIIILDNSKGDEFASVEHQKSKLKEEEGKEKVGEEDGSFNIFTRSTVMISSDEEVEQVEEDEEAEVEAEVSEVGGVEQGQIEEGAEGVVEANKEVEEAGEELGEGEGEGQIEEDAEGVVEADKGVEELGGGGGGGGGEGQIEEDAEGVVEADKEVGGEVEGKGSAEVKDDAVLIVSPSKDVNNKNIAELVEEPEDIEDGILVTRHTINNVCPITKLPFQEPWQNVCGHVYEMSAIKEIYLAKWRRYKHCPCPVSGCEGEVLIEDWYFQS